MDLQAKIDLFKFLAIQREYLTSAERDILEALVAQILSEVKP